jgi:hypothetical protein
MGEISRALAAVQFQQQLRGRRGMSQESLAALPKIAGTRAVLYRRLMYGWGIHEPISAVTAGPNQCPLAWSNVEFTAFVSPIGVRSAKAAAASRGQDAWRDVVRPVCVDHRHGLQ